MGHEGAMSKAVTYRTGGNLSMRRNAHTRPRRFTLVVLSLAVSVVSTLCEAKSKRIHVTAPDRIDVTFKLD
jgi:hypothetical protein